MPADNAKKEDQPGQTAGPRPVTASGPSEPPLEGTLTAEDIREIEASGITLADVIREIEAQVASAPE